MDNLEKKNLSERDICSKFITPAIILAGWDHQHQIREEVNVTNRPGLCQGQFSEQGKTTKG